MSRFVLCHKFKDLTVKNFDFALNAKLLFKLIKSLICGLVKWVFDLWVWNWLPYTAPMEKISTAASHKFDFRLSTTMLVMEKPTLLVRWKIWVKTKPTELCTHLILDRNLFFFNEIFRKLSYNMRSYRFNYYIYTNRA